MRCGGPVQVTFDGHDLDCDDFVIASDPGDDGFGASCDLQLSHPSGTLDMPLSLSSLDFHANGRFCTCSSGQYVSGSVSLKLAAQPVVQNLWHAGNFSSTISEGAHLL